MRRKSRASDDQAEIDLTPMLDVTFIMLIFFIVTTSFSKEVGIDMNRPTAAPTQQQKIADVIAIEVGQNGEVTVNDRPIDVAAVRANVERARAEKPDASVIVIIHPSASTSTLVRVVDQAREAGASNISVAATSTS